jgi:GNAT superfamily N-acetyltransferase
MTDPEQKKKQDKEQTFTWRLLTAAELARVYEQQMRRDFPPAELKPLAMLQHALESGVGYAWGVFAGGEEAARALEYLAAYLLMVRPAGCPVSQLDYFAVLPAFRAQGLGGRLLAELPAREQDAAASSDSGAIRAILIEAECPEHAQDEPMAHRRLGFYARAGTQDTGWTEHLFDTWFRILVLPCAGAQPMPAEVAVRWLAQCYRHSIPEDKWTRFVHFYRPGGAEAQF